jgi:hypothetical protein
LENWKIAQNLVQWKIGQLYHLWKLHKCRIGKTKKNPQKIGKMEDCPKLGWVKNWTPHYLWKLQKIPNKKTKKIK